MKRTRFKQPTVHVNGHLQLTRSGVVTATYFVTPLDYGLRPDDEKESIVAPAHKSLIQAVPSGTVFMGLVAPMDMREVLKAMIGAADIDTLEEYAEECSAAYNRLLFDVQPETRLHLMCMPVLNPPSLGSALTRQWRAGERYGGRLLTREQTRAALANASSILSKIDDVFGFRPVPSQLFAWLWEHNLSRGVSATPPPSPSSAIASGGGTTPTRAAFEPALLDEGAQTDRPLRKRWAWRLPNSRVPVLKVLREDPLEPPSYQTMLTIKSFPSGGMAFPGGSEFLTVVDGLDLGGGDDSGPVSVDWAMWVERHSAEDTIRKNSAALRRLDEQVVQREHEASFAANSLMDRGMQLGEYTGHLEANDGESEVVFTVALALGAMSQTPLQQAADRIRSAYKKSRIEWRQPVGAQVDLWSLFHPGAAAPVAWENFSHITPSDFWAGFVPFTSARIGDPSGPAIGANLLSGHFEPVHLDLIDHVVNDFSACVACSGDLGSGKSYFLKSRCLDIVDLGGQFLAIDGTAMNEYGRLAAAITDSTEVDLAHPRVSLDPLRIFGNDHATAVSVSLGTLLPLLGTDPMSDPGILMANLLAPATRREHEITSIPALHRYLCEYTDRHPGDSVEATLLRAMNAIAHLAPVLFDPSLPVLELTTPATVVRTHGLDLPSFDEMKEAHLYRRMGAPKLLGQAMLELTAVLASRAFLQPNGRFGALVTDEAHRLTGSPIGTRVMRDFANDGRKNGAGLFMASPKPREHFRGVDGDLVPIRLGFRQPNPDLAHAQLEWLGIDPTANPHLVKRVRYGLSPMNASGKVSPGREGEAMMRDGRGRIGIIKTFGPARQHRIDAINTTPSLHGRAS
ncbi:ATP-binding protein [Nocardia brasiliensis]|uniref:ATP-binding protein n=1 Tax=Nocardia brasiliensis TaxID=37326 RepID=UPI0024541FB0|nr:ATP-binding protein [Nocardia brasiliensis]